ncbi:MAG: beta-lactamase family protein [Cyclobacteriaceae bacterium]|nr:beta-lactamase family protein [Cyclobacteriaceae bacterium]
MNKFSSYFLLVVAIGCASNNDKTGTEFTTPLASVQKYSIPHFEDTTTFVRLESLFPVVDKIYRDYAKEHYFPALSYGVIAGGKLIYSNNVGTVNLEEKTPATSKSLFRIASMSKSFTAMAILKLRDEGKLNVTDPVSKYIPEIIQAGALTNDAPPITIQHLLTMSAGFPEDNPWGDRQLDATDNELIKQIREGISFSNVPGVTFEYSNMGFAMLGKIISSISGTPYQQYITENIMKPIGMNDSKWEFDDVPKEQLALGYQRIDNEWKEIPLLHDGAYGAMGGLICSIEDFSKYVALHLGAWPARNEVETGPVRRSSIREMHQPWRFNNLFTNAKTRSGELCPIALGYGYGLDWEKDCNGLVRISHSGGLPGFGSEWRIYPEYGIGIVSFSNHTYGAPGAPNALALDTLISLAGLKPRVLPPSEILSKRQREIAELLPAWNEDQTKVFAENFFWDESLVRRKEATRKIFEEAGAILSVKPITPENQLRGGFIIEGSKKNVWVFFTLTPEREALIQQLDVELMDK